MGLFKELARCYIASIIILLVVLFIVKAVRAEELYNYEVYGQNMRTGLTVAGYMWEADKDGNIRAKVFDMLEVQDQCNGTWVGHGVARVGCGNGYQYVLMVVEK